ncbi:MAG: diaminopimelate decarboxylase [Chthoniobacterales bacterium]
MKTPTAYEPPRIELLETGHMNRTAYGTQPTCCKAIDGIEIEELLKAHGSPLFVFSERTLRQTFQRAKAAFARHYPNFQFAWSYKTNYLKAICAVFHSEGAFAEVVSEFEYEKARGMGILGKEIIFNGPHKPRNVLRRALLEGARIQIDHFEELIAVEEIVAEEALDNACVSLRLYLDAGIRPIWSKFGFNLEDGEAWRAAQRLHHGGVVRLTGLHTHLGTFILDPNAYRIAAGKLTQFAARMHKDLGFEINTLNMGGGFASRNTLHGQYLPAEQITPDFEAYAAAISEGIFNNLPVDMKPPKLLLESGRSLVDEAGYLLTTVIANKRNRLFSEAAALATAAKGPVSQRTASCVPGSPAIIVDAGVHLLYTANWYRHKIQPVRASSGQPVPTTVYGCLCMNIDVIQEATPLPGLSPGDTLVIHPVGAYNITQSMQFIGYRPAVVMVMENGDVEVIRSRETLAYVEALEYLPEFIRNKKMENITV